MSSNKVDIFVKDVSGRNVVATEVWATEAAATAIYAGEPVKNKSTGSPYVIPLADGDPTTSTATPVVGIAKSNGTHTASADGTVEVYVVDANTILAAKAKSSTAADTASEIAALKGKQVVLDLTSGTYTVDTAAANANTNGIVCVGGDHEKGLIYFKIRSFALQGPIA
jgi:hypothetical protein